MTVEAPQFVKISLNDIEIAAPIERGTPEFEQAAILQTAAEYALKGMQGFFKVEDNALWGFAFTDKTIDPKAYVLGILQDGYLEDALPMLEAMSHTMQDDDVEYNLGICLSELGRIPESIAPLKRCLELNPKYMNAIAGLGVSYGRMRDFDQAEKVLRAGVQLDPENAYIKRNLGGVLLSAGKAVEGLPFLRQAASLMPSDPTFQMALAQCLESVGGSHVDEAGKLYESIMIKHDGEPIAEAAKAGRNRISNTQLHEATSGSVRPDAIAYMQSAIQRFASMEKMEAAKVVMEIARLGEGGLKINDSDHRYTLNSIPGDFSGLQLLCMMHVGLKGLDPNADSGSGLDQEYEMAKRLEG
ncbi:MAG: tetratricopeptide repeat protein [Fluviibacter phosphoraccumulans]